MLKEPTTRTLNHSLIQSLSRILLNSLIQSFIRVLAARMLNHSFTQSPTSFLVCSLDQSFTRLLTRTPISSRYARCTHIHTPTSARYAHSFKRVNIPIIRSRCSIPPSELPKAISVGNRLRLPKC